ncbi:2-oxoglutarate dehydrogenase, E2 component, dihydrolipoamide succinyltransferase [Actinocatenispora rupis]|uniref:Dihydrolipoamide acetyltransferase component of pyruvate dehydrogenase complex n=2 Tax=Actinocatenispora rupis TaxID=519421 RepID=A0A8J3J0I1_9ACTN|nr:2-oxoglutarate dehydrogenase, E2 component, dihydrolipoamide succinyltransferase [Actinocatenispora rupis]GID09692.1 dihydrolipoamide acetyltransferase component of pyruvate dehydrogenase complex [Actinocatenispora rupis]
MPTSVTMPQLGESVTEGTVTRWLKQEGDRVEADEPLLEVSTDKVDTEIPSPASGVLSRIVVPEDETVEVGAELAQIAGEGEDAPAAPAPAAEPAAAPAEAPAPAAPAAEAPAAPAQEAPAAPAPAAAPSAGGTDVTMPVLGESVTEGTVTRWLKQVGETVEVDEPLLEVSTDKVDTEIPSPAAGTVQEIRVQQDETVDVGTVLAVIGSGQAASAPAAAPEPTPAPAAPAPAAPAPAAPAPAAPAAKPAPPTAEPVQQSAPVAVPAAPAPSANGSGDGPSGYVTPLVRKLAAEHGIDLASLSGTGVGGRIRKQDVLDAAEAKKAAAAKPAPAQAAPAAAPAAKSAPSPLRGRTEKLSRMRQVIAKRMVESLQTSAQLTTVIEVDVTTIARLRNKAKAEFQQRHGVKLSFLPFFALAAVEALREHPKLNASINTEENTVTYHDQENLVIAVDTDRGLLVPVIHNAGDLNLAGLARRIADLAERTRDNKVSPDELAGGTFTLTNTGSRGALFDTPIFPQPQVAMLGTGAVVKRAVVVDDPQLGEIIVPRSMVYLALSYDHRLIDGADAARFLATVKERLEGGAFEADLGL